MFVRTDEHWTVNILCSVSYRPRRHISVDVHQRAWAAKAWPMTADCWWQIAGFRSVTVCRVAIIIGSRAATLTWRHHGHFGQGRAWMIWQLTITDKKRLTLIRPTHYTVAVIWIKVKPNNGFHIIRSQYNGVTLTSKSCFYDNCNFITRMLFKGEGIGKRRFV